VGTVAPAVEHHHAVPLSRSRSFRSERRAPRPREPHANEAEHVRRSRDRPLCSAHWDRMRRMPGSRRLVASSTPLRPMRAHRLLRLLPLAARKPPRSRCRSPADPQLRTWRGLVLELHHRSVLRRSAARPTRASSARSAYAWTRRASTGGLAAPPPLRREARRPPFARPDDVHDRGSPDYTASKSSTASSIAVRRSSGARPCLSMRRSSPAMVHPDRKRSNTRGSM
jgi:hypothetical protein